MPVELELKVPEVGESITEVQIGRWHKEAGQRVEKDESVVELESDKATVDLPAPGSGTISKVLKSSGQTAAVGEVIGYVLPSADVPAASAPPKTAAPAVPRETAPPPKRPSPAPTAPARVMPAAERVMAQSGIAPESVRPTGPGGRILKEDVLRHIDEAATAPIRATVGDSRTASTELTAPPLHSPLSTLHSPLPTSRAKKKSS